MLITRSTQMAASLRSVVVLCSLVFSLICLLNSAIANTLDTYTVKIALVRNLAVFTEWPESVFINSPDTMNLCVVGDNIVQQAFFELTDRLVSGRKLMVIDINKTLSLSACHVIFIGSQDRLLLSRIHNATLGRPILTIDDMAGVSTYSGVVNLQTIDGKIRLNINLEVAKKAQLKISSRLLKLATIVSVNKGIEKSDD